MGQEADMLRWIRFLPVAFLSACAGGCSIARALYVAVVHNSGAPPRDELVRIEERERELGQTLRAGRLLVLPVAVLGKVIRYDTTTAASIARQLRDQTLAIASSSADAVVLPLERQPNEALILWTRFKALAVAVAEHPRTDTDYIMQVDVIGAPEREN